MREIGRTSEPNSGIFEMKKLKKITVVIPCYNEEKAVRKFLFKKPFP